MSQTTALLPTARVQASFDFAAERTQLTGLFCAAPLKIARTFARGAALDVCVMDASPGMLAGDFYEFDWRLEKHAQVRIGTQGFTRVHPSRENPCRLRQRMQVSAGAVLEYFPEPLMLYANASLRAETEVEIGDGATLLMAEVLCAGRVARGEAFAFEHYTNRLRVRRGGQLIYCAQNSLSPAQFAPQRRGAWDDFTHQAGFVAFSPRASREACVNLREILAGCPNVYGGASLLEGDGVAAFLLGRRACDLQEVTGKMRDIFL